MPKPKKTPEDLELATHNRLKGTICFHVTSAISQLRVLENKLKQFKVGCNDTDGRANTSTLLASLAAIQAATDRFKLTLYSRLEIGKSPSSYRNRSPRTKKQQYPHVSNQ